MMPIICAFYTENTPYEEEIKKILMPSLIKFNLKHKIVPIPKKGKWLVNVAEKPKIILDLLNEYEEIVFVDADAEFLEYPELFYEIPKKYDVACHFLEWESWYGYKGDKTKELLSGTMFFRSNDKVKNLCVNWYEQATSNNIWEQKALESIIHNSPIEIYNLPIEYCYIKSLPGNREPLVKCNPVVLHHQVSRQYKRIIR